VAGPLRDIPINLALQGGGAHGAFTWGVLDRLLEEPRLRIGCISAASAGAVNAVALAAGWIDGGPQGARARLDMVWEAVLKAQVPDFMRSMARISMTQIMSLFSPYEFNPLGFDPLRDLLNAHIDFKRVRAAAPFELLISATAVQSGRVRLFRRFEITVDAVLASACLPTLHHALVIDGVAYWDGGFSANPDLVTLAGGGHAGDTLIVLLNSFDAGVEAGDVLTRPREIAAQVNALTFNLPLARDLGLIAQTQAMSRLGLLRAPTQTRNIWRHRFHLITAAAHTRNLPAISKAEPDADTFAFLKEAGRHEATAWLAAHGANVGRCSSAAPAALVGR
jgi:NTE family protein